MCRDKDTLADYGFDASHLELTTEMDRFSDSEDSTQEYALNDFQNGQAIEVEEDMAFHVDDFATAATIEVPIDIDVDNIAPHVQNAWVEARLCLIHDRGDPSTTMTVMQAAFRHVEAVHHGASIAKVEQDIQHILSMFGPECGAPAPDNPLCRYPRSYYICKVVCGVSDLTEAEVHVCAEDGCKTVFPHMPRKQLLEHVAHCSSVDCKVCHCPCGGRRMHDSEYGNLPQPVAPCYVFEDVFQQFFMDVKWYEHACDCHEAQSAAFYSNPEGKRILELMKQEGIDISKVCHIRMPVTHSFVAADMQHIACA